MVFSLFGGWRLVVLGVAALAVSGCAQPSDKVAIGIGTSPYIFKNAGPYADLLTPYAKMASLAYSDEKFQTDKLCPDVKAYGDPRNIDALHSKKDNDRAGDWIKDLTRANWACVGGNVGRYKCAPDECVGGLQFHIWRKGCHEAVLSFRGTDVTEDGPLLSRGDLVSNLRWFITLPVDDEYDQAARAARDFVKTAESWHCGRGLRLITVGHSLGGGLAQHAAFADKRYDYVYAFDPSPVTGVFDITWESRRWSMEKLGIDRIYESGEVLSLPRYLVSGAFATSPCQPRIRIVRFATTKEPSLLRRHSMANLAEGISHLAGARQKPAPRLPTGYDNARSCDFTGHDPELAETR